MDIPLSSQTAQRMLSPNAEVEIDSQPKAMQHEINYSGKK
jgi:hypothetical protein